MLYLVKDLHPCKPYVAVEPVSHKSLLEYRLEFVSEKVLAYLSNEKNIKFYAYGKPIQEFVRENLQSGIGIGHMNV